MKTERGRQQQAKIVKNDNRSATLLDLIPGIELKTIVSFIAFVDDMNKFHCAKQFSAYCGLMSKVYQPGQKNVARKTSKVRLALRGYLIKAVLAMM